MHYNLRRVNETLEGVEGAMRAAKIAPKWSLQEALVKLAPVFLIGTDVFTKVYWAGDAAAKLAEHV